MRHYYKDLQLKWIIKLQMTREANKGNICSGREIKENKKTIRTPKVK